MNDPSDQARFAAREFVARWIRETGESFSEVVTDRMLFAYEMGFLRGRSAAMRDAVDMFNVAIATPQDAVKKGDDDAE